MGVSWSKEEQLGESGGPLNKDTLVHIFEYFHSLDDLVNVALVNRGWASLLGASVVPTVLKRLKLKAWYTEDSIEAVKVRQAPAGVEACTAWKASLKAVHHLLDAFAYPATLKARVPALDPEAEKGYPAWTAHAVKGGEPRVVSSKAGRRSVQFVDVPGRHAVHLRTDAFAKALPQPLTVMCVGIAFEDATFVSGIHDRFEVCHAYPGSETQSLDERAPVSMTAHPVGDSSDSDDDPNPSCIVTGNTQPGDWHVYTAVFNGATSELYVDGKREGEGHANVGAGLLDGLTIGSDHRNDFPLGSMVEGTIPGVMAELLVFGSVLPVKDRQRVERKLMRDHGIAAPSLEREETRARTRQAHAMLMERAPGTPHKPCPLRFLARHTDVSWSIAHPVTGEKIRPKRIGVRETAESSGWDD